MGVIFFGAYYFVSSLCSFQHSITILRAKNGLFKVLKGVPIAIGIGSAFGLRKKSILVHKDFHFVLG
jgi:hypothetical protein